MATQLKRDELMRLARVGAVARLAELRREIAGLQAMVGGAASVAVVTPHARKRAPRRAAPAARRAAASWSSAARKAVSLRMKKYWAARRQAKKS